MFTILAATMMLVGSMDDTPLNEAQLRDLIRAKTAPLKSLIFVYEGQYRLLEGRNGDKGIAGVHDQDFQGTFLYRSDGAALYDLYTIYPARSGGVTRKKASLLKGQVEKTSRIMDSKQQLQQNDITSLKGNLVYLEPSESPIELWVILSFIDYHDDMYRDVAVEGWEMLDGRNCLRVRLSVFAGPQDHDKERHQRLYWIDPERNAQVWKMEWYQRGSLVQAIDDVRMAEYHLKDGSSYWLPGNRSRGLQLALEGLSG